MEPMSNLRIEGQNPGCWFCDDRARELPPTGWLIEDRTWRAGVAPAEMSIPGTVILETRRHVLDQAHFTADESATHAAVIGRLLSAIRAATGCDRIYQWASMAEFPHYHLWLLPWWATNELAGPAYLADVVHPAVVDEAATAAVARRIADRLRPAGTGGGGPDPGPERTERDR